MPTSTEKQEYISLGSLCKGNIVATSDLSAEIEKKISNNASGTTNIAIGKASISNSNNSIAIGTNGGTSIVGNTNIAIGYDAKVTTYSAAQIGPGTNSTPKSFQFRGTQIVDGNGKIPAASLDAEVREKDDLYVYYTMPDKWTVAGYYSDGTYTWDDASNQWLKDDHSRAIRPTETADRYQFVYNPEQENIVVAEFAGTQQQTIHPTIEGETRDISVQGIGSTMLPSGDTLAKSSQFNSKSVKLGKNAAYDDDYQIAIGQESKSYGWGSVSIGSSAHADQNGTSVGDNAYSTKDGVAIGHGATSTAEGAAQIGAGTNSSANSLKFMNTEIVNSSGKIPATQLSAVFSSSPELTDWEITTDNQDLDLTGAEVRLDTSSSTTYPGIVVPAISPTTPQTGIPFEIDSNKVDELLKITAITQYGSKETTIIATRARADVSYKLGDQGDKLLQPAKSFVTFPKYNGKNHKWLQAYGGQTPYSDPEIQDFNKGGEHDWSPGRRCIVYVRLHNDTGSTRHIQIYVNQRDTDHVVIDTWLNPNIGEALPVFLNADDTLMLTLGGDSSVTGYVINFSVYFVE